MTIPPPPPPRTPRHGLPSWGVTLIVVGALFVALLFALGGGLSVLFILAAVAAIVVAIVGLTRPLSALGITSRRRAGSVLAVAAVALLIASINTGVSAGHTPSAQVAHRTLVDAPTDVPSPSPSIEVRQVTDTTPIPFQATTVNDGNMDVGTSAVTTAGVAGVTTTTYTATFVDGVEASRVKTGEQVTTAPVDQVTSVGTRTPAPPPPAQKAPIASSAGSSDGGDCDPNYADACVPNASDVDCAGGGGNGPAYLNGQARVVGRDVYDLDRDHDGIACD